MWSEIIFLAASEKSESPNQVDFVGAKNLPMRSPKEKFFFAKGILGFFEVL